MIVSTAPVLVGRRRHTKSAPIVQIEVQIAAGIIA
jgi:hypothetical protein